MKYEDFDPLSQKVSVTITLQELGALYSAVVDAFGRMTESSPFWKETDKLVNEISDITVRAGEEKVSYDEYARANR